MDLLLAHDGLSYTEVRTILALLDGWPKGRVHFETGDLIVEARTDGRGEREAVLVQSPAVGTFVAEPSALDAYRESRALSMGTLLGRIDAPLRSTPVFTPSEGKVIAVLAEPNTFVEYDQTLVILEGSSHS